MQTVVTKRDGDALIAYLTCELDQELSSLAARELVLDFSQVSFMDSSGIGLILGRLERCKSLGMTLCVRGHTGLISRLISMSGIKRLGGITVE